jgi:predicted P-loop ATPase
MAAQDSKNIDLHIAIGRSRKDTRWQVTYMKWGDLVARLRQPIVTQETVSEYAAMSRERQGEIKDVGGFVGGVLRDGQRKNGCVETREVLTLDIDHGTADTWQHFTSVLHCAAVMHSTHKHTPEKPRYRLVMPLRDPLTAGEYESVARSVAQLLGIDEMDDTTYQAARLMYWPSHSRDGEWFFREQKGAPLDGKRFLTAADGSAADMPTVLPGLPQGVTPMGVLAGGQRVEDPTTKGGAIGAFCSAYSIDEAIAKYLSHIYAPTSQHGRYTYRGASTTGGLMTFEQRWAYSFHESDPVHGRLLNAFDLCRLHLFGAMDAGKSGEDTAMPSYKKMLELAADATRATAVDDFADIDDDAPEPSTATLETVKDNQWRLRLKTKKDKVESSSENVMTILENDPDIAGRLWHDDFSGFDIVEGALPWDASASVRTWSNRDDANLRVWLDKRYGIRGKDIIKDAREAVLTIHHKHPVRDYLEGLQWDGTERLDTMLVDLMGAEDSQYVRAVTRKHFTAAVARVMRPGCKYDYCLILCGPEGVGKSTLFAVMGGKWFSDSAITMEGKQGMEQAGAGWLIELSELGGMKKSEVEQVKAYLSRQDDIYRPAYGTVVERHPRQCVFCGTTNEDAFLRGDTGNRRFWPVNVTGVDADVRDQLMQMRDQLWAEAVHRYRQGERLYLDRETEAQARAAQEAHNVQAGDPMEGMLDEWLDAAITLDWETKDMWWRRKFYANPDPLMAGTVWRQQVCAAQFISERMGIDMGDPRAAKIARQFNALMRGKEGWKSVSTTTNFRFYGRQRGFERTGVIPCGDEF